VYHSGDLGFLDPEGNLFIRGRRNELILRGGSNVYPAEVERVLRGHPAVADCAVLGRADVRLGQRVVAAVVLRVGAVADATALESHCRAELARYKVPEAFRFVAALPRNAMGKVTKRELEPLFEET
jgi:acyl-CoA synthetase (AMP-forming)/AMP-acid ligase II